MSKITAATQKLVDKMEAEQIQACVREETKKFPKSTPEDKAKLAKIVVGIKQRCQEDIKSQTAANTLKILDCQTAAYPWICIKGLLYGRKPDQLIAER